MFTVGVPEMVTAGVFPMLIVPATVTVALTAEMAPIVLLPGPIVTGPVMLTVPLATETTGLLATPGVGEMSTPPLSQMMIAAPAGCDGGVFENCDGMVQLARATSVFWIAITRVTPGGTTSGPSGR